MLGRQQVTVQQQFNQQNQMFATMRNIQISKLKQDYPDLVLLKESSVGHEYRVPLSLPVSSLPLYIKVVLTQNFPVT